MKQAIIVSTFAVLAASAAIADDAVAPPELSPPPIAVDGYCIVSTLNPSVWIKGEADIYTDYRGRRYLFLSEEEKVKFDASPKKFAPVLEGLDAVALFDRCDKAAGSREWACHYDGRMFFFASEKNIQAFMSSPDRYVDGVQVRERLEARIENHEAKRGKSIAELTTDD